MMATEYIMVGSNSYEKVKTFKYLDSLLILVRINLPLFSTVLPSNSRLFLPFRPLIVITFSIGLVSIEVTSVSWLGQLTVGV